MVTSGLLKSGTSSLEVAKMGSIECANVCPNGRGPHLVDMSNGAHCLECELIDEEGES